MKVDDPKAMLALWCTERGLRPPVYVASNVAGGVEVVGSLTLDGGRYLRAFHRASRAADAQLDVSRDLFVQVQGAVGPIALSAAAPHRSETKSERLARRAAEREALDQEKRQRGAYLYITAHFDRGLWSAQGLWQVGHAQTVAGPFQEPTRELAEARVVAHLLQLCKGDGVGRPVETSR